MSPIATTSFMERSRLVGSEKRENFLNRSAVETMRPIDDSGVAPHVIIGIVICLGESGFSIISEKEANAQHGSAQ